jgi:5-keto 4-deoxyuronate isomerase
MELRTAASPRDVKHYTTERLREEFLINDQTGIQSHRPYHYRFCCSCKTVNSDCRR